MDETKTKPGRSRVLVCCFRCQNEFWLHPCRIKKHLHSFCSAACYYEYKLQQLKTKVQLAKEFGVSWRTIHRVVKRIYWKEVE